MASGRSWSDDEPDYDGSHDESEREWGDCGPPERDHYWDVELKGTTQWGGSGRKTNTAASEWWQKKKEQAEAAFARHGRIHPALGWNYWAAGHRYTIYRSPRCGRINRNDDLRWDKYEGRGDRYAVLSDGHEVLMIVATAPAFKKRGSDRANYGTNFIRPGLG